MGGPFCLSSRFASIKFFGLSVGLEPTYSSFSDLVTGPGNLRYPPDQVSYCQISDFVKINPSSREGPFILPSIRYELQRSNYWYRTCYRANMIWNKVCFWKPEGLKGRILNLMWIYFNKFLTTIQPARGLSFVFVTFVDFETPSLNCVRLGHFGRNLFAHA